MNILIVTASKHGSTEEIGDAIGAALRETGHAVDVFDAAHAPPVQGYDAVVIGSGVYAGSWLGEARKFIDANQAALAALPVWLFSSGPLGEDEPQPKDDPTQLPELLDKTGAKDHRVFVGKLDKESLNLLEKLIIKVVKAPYGDFRDWDAIRAWAQEIDKALMTVAPEKV